MTEKKTSQAQQSNPFADAAEAHFARMAALAEEMANLEQQTAQRTADAIDEMARLGKETLAHGARLSAEWRKMSMEAFERSMALAKTVGRA